MSQIKEVLPGIFTWAHFDEERQINFNGHFLANQGESVIIDPAVLNEEGLKELAELLEKNKEHPLKAILLTNVHHDRISLGLKEKFNVPIYIHELDKGLLDASPDATFKDGDTLFCGLKVIHLSGQKSPGESGLYLEKEKILVVGDALIGRVAGKVNLLPPDKYKDVDQARAGLNRLREIDFETLLVGDGNSILNNARQPVMEFLDG